MDTDGKEDNAAVVAGEETTPVVPSSAPATSADSDNEDDKDGLLVGQKDPSCWADVYDTTDSSMPKRVQNSADGSSFAKFITQSISAEFDEAVVIAGKPSPDDRPYDNMYAAREALERLLASVEDEMKRNPPAEDEAPYAASCELRLRNVIGELYVETDEVSSGCTFLEQVVTAYSKDNPLSCYTATIFLDSLNRLGVVWAERKEYQKALAFLQASKHLYTRIKAKNSAPWTRYELVPKHTESEREDVYEGLYTHTLFYLAQCFGQMGEEEQATEHIQLTLIRQYETSAYDNEDWALNVAAISQFYLSELCPMQALACLSCAQAVLDASADQGEAMEESGDEDESRQEKRMGVVRCWIMYYLHMLEASSALVQSPQSLEDYQPTTTRTFPLRVPGAEKYLDQVPVTYAKNIAEARVFFIQGQKWVQHALEQYTVDEHATDHIACVQYHSTLYKHLAVFEDPSNASKMHKRRTDMLRAVLDELNPQFYLAICKQLAFEIGSALQEMFDLKTDILKKGTTRVDPKAILKATKIGDNAIKHFQKFIDLHRDHNKELPQTYDDAVTRGVMTAHFNVARMYSRLYTSTKEARAANLHASLRYYKYIVDYCSSHSDFTEFQTELSLAKEMVELIPAQVARL